MTRNSSTLLYLPAVAYFALASCSSPQTHTEKSTSIVIGIEEKHLGAQYWVDHARNAGRVTFTRDEIAAENARLLRLDPSLHDIEGLPSQLDRAQVRRWIEKLSEMPERPLFDEHGTPVAQSVLQQLQTTLALDAIPATQTTRYGLVVQRADLRTFPTRLRVFSDNDDTDIDRFQESALFPGTPVVIAHTSADGDWLFVVSSLYAAWIDARAVAQGSAPEVFGYTRKTPYIVVTGANARTVFTPERPEVSELKLDMGVRVPALADWPQDRPVNGQGVYTSHVVELPWRTEDGTLRFSPALIPKTADVAADYLPLTAANVVRQGFKFLGERYGWGHSYDARDCSGFVSEVYRSFGAQLPRNTRDQGVSPALERVALDRETSHEARLALVRTLEIGDLVYIPGHVMMVIGRERDVPYVIHDTSGITYRQANGELRGVKLNGVAVTPLTPLLLGNGQPFVDRIYSIVRLRRR
jgi:cell wall-associated NlpC family hydrolase